MLKKKRKIHYAWISLVGCCVMQSIGFGLALNSMGVFFPYMAEHFQTGTGRVALFMTIQGLVMTAVIPSVGKIVPKYNYNVILTIAALVMSSSYLLMSRFTALWQWYLLAIPTGAAIAFIAPTPISIVLSNWFEKKRGFAAGIAFAWSGIAGAILVPTCNWIIDTLGWRSGCIYYGIVVLVLLVPTALFVIRKTPEEMGMLPYGAEDGGQADKSEAKSAQPEHIVNYGITLKEARRRPSFYLILIISISMTWAGGMNPQFPTHATVIGMGAMVGSIMSSCCLVMQLIFNVPLGMIIDKHGVQRALPIYASVAACGSMLLCFSRKPLMLYGGSMLYGIGMCITIVVSSELPRVIYGRREYGQISAFIMTAFGAAGALGYVVNGALRDITGNYTVSFILAAAADIIAIICCFIVLRLEKDQIAHNKAMEGMIERPTG